MRVYVDQFVGNVSETPTPTTCLKSTAVHLQFVRQYVPHLYRCTFLASKLRRKGNHAIRLPFVLQCASHLYGSTFGKILGVGVTGTFLNLKGTQSVSESVLPGLHREAPEKRLSDEAMNRSQDFNRFIAFTSSSHRLRRHKAPQGNTPVRHPD